MHNINSLLLFSPPFLPHISYHFSLLMQLDHELLHTRHTHTSFASGGLIHLKNNMKPLVNTKYVYRYAQGWPEPLIHGVYLYGVSGREITKYAVINVVYIRFWPRYVHDVYIRLWPRYAHGVYIQFWPRYAHGVYIQFWPRYVHSVHIRLWPRYARQ